MATATFSQDLLSWYKKNARDLPWRRTRDPYLIWVSEVMLQQTTVATVIPYFERWKQDYPTLQSVAKAPTDQILKSWQGLGYYNRARNLQKAAQVICEKWRGQMPTDRDVLRALPGFGPYTTGAVLSIAFNQREPIIDANVRRVMMRQLAMNGFAETSQDKAIGSHLDQILPQKEMRHFNQALMELGALVCRSQEPLCIVCPVRRHCQAYSRGQQEIIPQVKKKQISEVKVVIAILKKGEKYFIQKRPPKGLFADLWEFPGGKIEPGEKPREALTRELKEELQVTMISAEPLFNVKQFYTQFKAQLQVFSCSVTPSPPVNLTHKWVTRKDFSRYPMPSGSARIVDRLLGGVY